MMIVEETYHSPAHEWDSAAPPRIDYSEPVFDQSLSEDWSEGGLSGGWGGWECVEEWEMCGVVAHWQEGERRWRRKWRHGSPR